MELKLNGVRNMYRTMLLLLAFIPHEELLPSQKKSKQQDSIINFRLLEELLGYLLE